MNGVKEVDKCLISLKDRGFLQIGSLRSAIEKETAAVSGDSGPSLGNASNYVKMADKFINFLWKDNKGRVIRSYLEGLFDGREMT